MKIIVPVNGFDISKKALEKAADIAKKEKYILKIILVIKERELNRFKRNSHLWRQVDGSIISGKDTKICDEMILFKIERRIHSILQELDIEGIEYEIEMIIGEPHSFILHTADDEEANLIVMVDAEKQCPMILVHEDRYN